MSRLPFKITLQGDNYVLVHYGFEVCVTSPTGEIEYLYTDKPEQLIKEMSKKNKYRTIPYIRTSNREVKKRLEYINGLGIGDMKDLVAYLGELCKYIEDGYVDPKTDSEILKVLVVESQDVYLESLVEIGKKLLKTLRKSSIAKGIKFKNVHIDSGNESIANISSIFESFIKLGNTDPVEFKGEDGKHLIIATEQDVRDLYATVYIHRSSSFGAEYEVNNRISQHETTIIAELSSALKDSEDRALSLLSDYFDEVYERRSQAMTHKYKNRPRS